MTDSFFTGRNNFDVQMEDFTLVNSEMLAEPCTRRITTLKGPFAAAVKIQRIADICATAHVLPIEHWRALAAVEPAMPAPAIEHRGWKVWRLIVGNPGAVFWSDFFLGLFVGAR